MVELNLVNMVGGIIIVFVFYLITSLVIREINEYIFRIRENTFHKSSQISVVLSILVIVQFLMGGNPAVNIIVGIIMIAALYFMLWKLYKISAIKAFLATAVIVLVFILLLALVAFLLLL